MQFDPEQINILIAQRRSVFPKMYSGEPVPRSVVEQMLENANWAPTHKFTQPWRFRVFSGAGLHSFAQWQSDLYRKRSQSAGNYQEKLFNKLLHKPTMASYVIAISMVRDPEERIPEMEEVAAVSCAVQNMYLTAAANGVGCYWSTGGPTFWEETKAYLGLEVKDKVMGFLFVGMPKDDLKLNGHRTPWQDKVSWVDD